jgi:periplasmic mercuric ion binding protein
MKFASIGTVALLVPFLATSWAFADTTVTVEKTHLCCGSCVKAAGAAVKSVEGAKAKCDQKKGTVTITASDEATAQKAVDALEAAGFIGTVTGAKFSDDSGVSAGNVKSLSISDLHNCCGKCTKAINAAIKTVPGATGEIAAKATSGTITGDFDAAKLVAALNEAGFHVKVSK